MRKLVLVVVLCMAVFAAAGCGENVTEKEITEDFYAAYDFWNSWVYGLSYCDYALDNPPVGPYVSVIKENCPIGSCEELEEEIRSRFSKELSDRMLDYLKPFEKDGRVCAYGVDVGGSAVEFENIVVEKINDEKYSVKFDTRTFYDDEYKNQVINHEVFYVCEDGKWVFENGEEEFFFARKLPGYLSEEYTPYNEVLRNYYAALWQKWDGEKLAENNMSNICTSRDEKTILEKTGFCLMDINGDGVDELLIGFMPEGYCDEDIYDLYTVNDGEVCQLALGGYRDKYFLSKDNEGEMIIQRRSSGGAFYLTAFNYKMTDSGLEFLEGVVYDKLSYPENPCFLVDDGEVDVSDDMNISKEEWDGIIEEYNTMEKIVPGYIAFSTLGS